MKKTIYLTFALAFVLIISTGFAQAADFRLGATNNGNLTVEPNEQIKNFYTAGNIVLINANIEKSLHVAGNVVTIKGNVEDSVYSVAGTLMIEGSVGGSVHGFGGNVIVSNSVAGDLIIGGGNVSISRQAMVGGDLVVGGGTVDIFGPIAGDVYIGGGIITIDSQISGDLKIKQADKIKIGKNAIIYGNLEYSSKNEIEIEEGAVILGETIIAIKKGAGGGDFDKGSFMLMISKIMSIVVLIKVVGLIIIGLLLLYLFKNFTEKTVKESLTNFWRNLGIGFVVLIAMPIVALILVVTIVGVWLSLILGTIYVLSLLIATVLSGIIFGSLFGKIVKDRKNYEINWQTVVGGTIALAVINFIPVIGWLIGLVFVLIGLGALYQIAFKTYKS